MLSVIWSMAALNIYDVIPRRETNWGKAADFMQFLIVIKEVFALRYQIFPQNVVLLMFLIKDKERDTFFFIKNRKYFSFKLQLIQNSYLSESSCSTSAAPSVSVAHEAASLPDLTFDLLVPQLVQRAVTVVHSR